MSKIKVLHIIKSLGRGGAEMLLPETLKFHNRQLFEFHYIYFLPWKNQMVDSLLANGGQVVCIRANNNLQLMLRLSDVVKYVKRHDIRLIHAHLPWAGILARIVGKISKIPVMYTEHNKQERYHVATRAMNLLTLNWLTCVVSVSQDVEESIRKHKPRLKCRLETILNGVNVNHFLPGQFPGKDIRQSLGIPLNAPVVGTIAVFRFQKRLDLWLELAEQISKKVSDAHFIIVGDGPLKPMLLQRADELGMHNRIHFTGLQTEVRPYLAAFDVYMMCSVFEGLPIALLEAMASGCPVASTDAGGIKEVIRDGIDGLLCNVNEPYKLVELATELLTDSETRMELAFRARQRIVDVFSMQSMVTKLEERYNEFALQTP